MRLRRRMEKDIESDIREHIEMMTRDNIERGMSPAEARNAAIRKFGSPLRVAEETKDVWRWIWADRLLQDTRYALRGLRRNPVFASVAILTLALGIGMNTAVFSVVSAVLIKPLPYAEPDRIVWLATYNQRFHFEAASAPDFADWRDQSKSFEEMAAYVTVDSTVQDGDQSAKHSFVSITPEFWRISCAHAALGRLFEANDRNVVVLTWRMFERRFGADPRLLGRAVTVDGRQTRIIGVLPKDFRFLATSEIAGGMSGEAEAFTPFVITPDLRDRSRGMLVTFVVAKLKPGISIEHARAEMQAIQTRIGAQIPGMMREFYRASEMRVLPLRERLVGGSRQGLLILLAAVVFVLLIACANLGNLLLARASARQSEIAIRAAIGAGRNRLLRQFIVEGLTLALAGGALGLALARGADALLLRVNPSAVPRLGEVAIDWRVLAFTLVVSALAGIIFGLAPIVSLSAGSLYSSLKEGGRSSSSAPAGLQLRSLLVAGELALAMVLLAGAGLMVKSFVRMYAHPATFQPEKIGLMKVFLSGPAYRDSQRAVAMAYTRRLLDEAGRVPGVDAVALGGVVSSGPVNLDGPPRWPRGQEPQVIERVVSSGYARVVGIPLLRGRWITDDEPSQAVVVNETFARRVFGHEDPLGKRIRSRDTLESIVGVVGDLKTSRLDAGPDPEILIPFQYTPTFRRLEILVKTPGSPMAVIPEVRRVVGRLDPSQPPYGVMTLESALSDSIAPRRFNLLLLGTFAASAVLLSLIGVYGVMSYAVTQRTREIGVRMALGARRVEVARMVLRQGMSVASAGIAVGTAAALVLTRLMASLLYDVTPTDPSTFAAVALGLAITALGASWIPALKAAGVDPLLALRHE
ncbi:MAG TPA: ABC transporter permease [Bryobacteraceae bacterium]|nr:ABC transporter permease [Bryobacteraceae bacterium]